MALPRNFSSKAILRLREQSTPQETDKLDAKLALSARIADEIEQKFDSKGAFAEAMGVSQGLVSRWISGTHNFTVDTLVEIEQVLKIRLIDRGVYSKNSISTMSPQEEELVISKNKVVSTYKGISKKHRKSLNTLSR